MLDPAYIRDNLAAVKANCVNRNVKADVDRVVELDDQRRRLISETQVLQQRQNELAKLIPKEKDKDKKQTLITEGRELRDKVAALETQSKENDAAMRAALAGIPNLSHPDAPVGTDAAANKVLRKVGTPRLFDFPAKDHVALAEALDLVDFEAGAAVAGQKFYFLKNAAVLLELALCQFSIGVLRGKGYTPIITPDLARVDILEGHRLHPARAGNADLQHRQQRPVPHRHC